MGTDLLFVSSQELGLTKSGFMDELLPSNQMLLPQISQIATDLSF